MSILYQLMMMVDVVLNHHSVSMAGLFAALSSCQLFQWTHVYPEWTMVDLFFFFSDGSGAIGSRVGLRIHRCAGTSQSAGPFWVLALTHIAVSFRTSDDLELSLVIVLFIVGHACHASKHKDFMTFQGWESKAWWVVVPSILLRMRGDDAQNLQYWYMRRYRMNQTSILNNLYLWHSMTMSIFWKI